MALHQIIDRRLAGKNKSAGNRERFMRRHQQQIREAVRRAVGGRAIRDMAHSEDVHIPRKDLSEPVFQHGEGGVRERVHPGNREYLTGDTIERPQGGRGSGGKGSASNSGEGEDDFVFTLSKEEFMQAFFDDLALPDLARTQLAQVPEYKTHRAGYVSDGMPSSLHIVRSMRGALGRRIALGATTRRAIEQVCAALALLPPAASADAERAALETELALLKAKLAAVAFLDPIDLRFRNRVRVPEPTTQAVMFCLMDVSGSMDEARKDLAKRFFILLYLFLTRHYEKIELVFIRHTTQAQEVDEQTFFHARESGGTVVSSALELMRDVIRARYNPAQWNIYAAQASDGDNWHDDSGRCRQLLADDVLPLVRYFAYVQVAEDEQSLWQQYAALADEHPAFALRKALAPDQIYPVLHDLFKKQGAPA